MKKMVLFAILALSVNALAQIKRPASDLPQSTLKAIEKIQGMMEDPSSASKTISGKIAEHRVKNQTTKDTVFFKIMDSVELWKWDTLSLGWEIESRITDMVCNQDGAILSQLVQNWDFGSWENFLLSTQTFNKYNLRTGSLHELWNGFEWDNIMRDSLQYEADTILQWHLLQNWNGSAWENSEREVYSYGGSFWGSIIQNWNGSAWVDFSRMSVTHVEDAWEERHLAQIWNNTEMMWENVSQYIFTLKPGTRLPTHSLYQSWNKDEWDDSSQIIYTYDAEDNLINELIQVWSDSDGAWVDYSKYTYTWDATNYSWTLQFLFYDGTDWVLYQQSVKIYDDRDYQISLTNKYWIPSGTEVNSGDSTRYYFHLTYDAIITNGKFDGMDGSLGAAAGKLWGMWSGNGGVAEVAGGVVRCTTLKADDNSSFQLMQQNFLLENGKTYTVSFDAWANIDRVIALSIEDPQNGNALLGTTSDQGSATGRSKWNVNITTVQTKYLLTFAVDAMKANTLTKLVFLLAQENGFVYIDNVSLVETGTSSVAGIEPSNIKLYPNPTENNLYFSGTSGLSKVVVYNILGAQVKEFTHVMQSIHVGDLSPGVYLLRLTDSGGHSLNAKIIKK